MTVVVHLRHLHQLVEGVPEDEGEAEAVEDPEAVDEAEAVAELLARVLARDVGEQPGSQTIPLHLWRACAAPHRVCLSHPPVAQTQIPISSKGSGCCVSLITLFIVILGVFLVPLLP